MLVLFTAVVAPALQIGLHAARSCSAPAAGAPPRWVGTLLRHHPTTRTWSMIEVMMIGVLVALIKIADYATVIPGSRCSRSVRWSSCSPRMQASFDPREVWARIDVGGGVGARRARRRSGREAEATS